MQTEKRSRPNIIILAIAIIVIAISGGYSIHHRIEQNKLADKISIQIKNTKKEITKITDDDAILMSSVGARIDTTKHNGVNGIQLNMYQQDYADAKSYESKIGLWNTMCDGFGNVVNNTKMQDPNIVISGDNLTQLNKHYKNTVKVKSLKTKLSALQTKYQNAKSWDLIIA